jgi:hypothetical protein
MTGWYDVRSAAALPVRQLRGERCSSLAFLSDAEQGAGVVVEDGPGGVRVDLGAVDVADRADEDVPVFVGEVDAELDLLKRSAILFDWSLDATRVDELIAKAISINEAVARGERSIANDGQPDQGPD